MVNTIKNLLINHDINETVAVYLSNAIAVIFIIIITIIVDLIVKRILLKILNSYAQKRKNKWQNILTEKKVFEILARIVPIGIIHAFAPVFPDYQIWIQRIAFSYIILIVLLASNRFLDAINMIYSKYEVSKARPIKGYLQVVEIISYTIGIVIIISIVIDRSPWILLSGIGAATAVLVLIFQNSILGLVASIQITSNNMLKLGDWIEMPKYGADGAVLEISLNTVKVQNWDNTIITVPTHLLISESFKNWRGMEESGGRRIMRSIYIDITSIKFCNEEMLLRFEEIQYIKEDLLNRKKEVDKYNKYYKVNSSHLVNAKQLTNIGTFRVYVENYLKNHPKVNQNMIQIVRQRQPTENGLPIEIYAFTTQIDWVAYESIQSDIFDHILAVAPEFDLRIFQAPTGYDFHRLRTEV
ncbi:mechanosensitive ion channel family protein [Clostridium vincentii]|uniref:Mechanosensing system component YbdG n=1 Tax=Clostridium vincentii TaxID=52704 RepID=A0A2T0BCM2_9CLOT|nr:mechanosensitive ion channel family protein [Clostridium vincentii]PRR81634.1 Miniconductance mechanosensitive channel YbdG [Clostridium vincentii]